MTCASLVRKAGPEDFQEIWRMFLQAYKENGLFSLSPEKVNWFMARALVPEAIPPGDTGIRGVIGVIGPPGSLEALVFVTIGNFWYSQDNHIEEFIVYVDPECRKSDHAQALVRWMKDLVEETQWPLVTGVISTARTEAKCRLYRRLLPKIGEFFYLGPKGSAIAPALVAVSS